MNGAELIDEVMDLIQDFSRESILRQLNKGLRSIANSMLLLPGLADGSDTVATVVGEYYADLPADYSRELFQARVSTRSIDIYANIGLLLQDFGGLSDRTGSVIGVAVQGAKLVYQFVPVVATDIDILYYRQPAALEDSEVSYPDGLGGTENLSDALDDALIEYAAKKLWRKVEQDVNGRKPETEAHEAAFLGAIDRANAILGRTRPRKAPPICRVNW